jgi:hypothetical protein
MATIVWAVRAACLLYLVLLTILLLAPDPWGWLLGGTPGIETPGRGVHFCAFAILAILSGASRLPWRGTVVGVVLVIYAILTETLQGLVETRVVEQVDYAENLLGLAVGAIVWALGRRFLRKSAPGGQTA